MSFFDDEDDEPPPNPRQAPRGPGPAGRRRPPGASANQQVQTRRIVAVVVVVVIVVVIALLVHGCQVSQGKSSLEDYSSEVYTLIGNSNDHVGKPLFSDLQSGQSASALQNDLNTLNGRAKQQLSDAEGLSVPGSMANAQQYVVQTLQQRSDGVQKITNNIQQALNSSTSEDGVRAIATAMSFLYSSDVIYKGYAAPAIARALHGSSLTVDSSTINAGQFVPDLGWLDQTFIASKIGAHLPSSEVNKTVPGGIYGHELTSVSVGGTTMTPGETNTLPASPAPKFQLNVLNSGNYNEHDVTCKVTVTPGGLKPATSTIAETFHGQTSTCTVALPKALSPGTYNVTAEVEKVPGEKNLDNNKQTFAVDFTG